MPKAKNLLVHLVIISLLVGFLLAIRFKPITQTFELDYDEGLNLIKTLLYSQGFSLYTQIWSDQPPLFTVLLSQWFSLFGQSVFAARFLSVLFSALLLWCFYQIIRRDLGIIPALVATVLLFNSWLYIRLSICVMIGIPSLSLAMLSIYFITLYKEHFCKSFLVLSGGLLALSLQTKLFTVFLIPLMLFSLLDFSLKAIQQKKPKNIWFHPLVLWLGTFGVIYIIIGLSYQQFSNFDQLLQSHLNQPIETKMVNFNNVNYLYHMISQDYEYIFIAVIGILAIFLKKQREGLFPLTWLLTAILIFLNHKPIWDHHYPLLAIPICWLAAYGVGYLLDLSSKNFKSANLKKLIPSLAVVLLIILVVATPANPKGRPPKNLEVMQLVLKYKGSTQWVFTDRPIYAFYAGLRVPPEMAVMSYKRLNSGDLTSKELLAVLQNYRPEQIILDRWTGQIKSDSQLTAYINKNYSKTYTDKKGITEHYILSALNM